MTFTYIKINEMRRIFDFVAFTFIRLPQIFVICTNLKSLFNFKKRPNKRTISRYMKFRKVTFSAII